MANLEAEIDDYSEFNKRLWKTKLEKSLKNSIFEFYSQLYHTANTNEKSLFSQKAKEAFMNTILCFQAMSLLWIPGLSISNWSDNKTMWEIIGYLRIDNIYSELGIIFEYLYLSVAITLIIFLFVISMVLLDYYSKNLPISILSSFKWVFDLWIILFFIPSLTLFSVILKYNFLPQEHVSVYKKNNNSNFELNVIWQIIIIILMVIMLFLIIFHAEFSGEIRHSLSSKVLKAKAHSKIDVHIAIFMYFSSIFYVITDENYMIYFQLLMMTTSLILIAEIIIIFPYFSTFFTLLKILGLFAIALISFGFILGYLMDNSLIIIFIAIFLGPLSGLFMIQFILKIKNKSNTNIPENLTGIKSKYQLEKSVRHSLCSNDIEHKDQIIHLFETFLIENIDKEKLQIIWIANYCLFSITDESLAKIKLSRLKNIWDWNFEADYQEYICNKNIQASLLSESAQFINYLQQLQLVKKKDLKLCVNLLKFWEELISSKPNLTRIIKRLDWIDQKLFFLVNKYSQLSTKFSNSRESLSIYASMMKDIILDKEKAKLLENKLNAINVMNFESKSFSCFDDSNAILIISAEEDNFGRILFSNTKAKDIMKCPSFKIDGASIMNFIPAYYREILKDCAIWFSHFCSESEITLNEGFFLDFPTESLKKCVGKLFVTTINNFLVFILVFNQDTKINQVALLSQSGEILSHSKDFPKIAEKYTENLVGYNLKNLISGKKGNFLCDGNALSEKNLFYSSVQFQNLKIFYAFIINDYVEKSKNIAILDKKEPITRQSLLESEWLKIRIKKASSGDELNSEMHLNHSSFNNNNQEINEALEDQQNKKLNKLMVSSSRKINILHIAFILSILSVLGTNIAVLFYAFSNINFIRNMDLPLALGDIDSRLQQVSLTSRIIWSLDTYGGPAATPIVELAWSFIPGQLNSLKELYFNITASLEDWNYCSAHSIFVDQNIKLWSSNENGEINLLDLLSKSIQVVNSYIGKWIWKKIFR